MMVADTAHLAAQAGRQIGAVVRNQTLNESIKGGISRRDQSATAAFIATGHVVPPFLPAAGGSLP
jgi:hypothetical protein